MLGLVSLFMDTSSEMIHSVLPVFLVSVIGSSVVTVGIIEGLADATAQVTKVFSGAISDIIGKRKLLTLMGYGLAAATKPMFPLANSAGWVLIARFVDRFGKGIRGAPRDALIADAVSAEHRGASFGLRQGLDSVGAVLGPLLAFGLLAVTADNLRLVMWFALIPAILCVLVLAFGVNDPKQTAAETKSGRLRFSDLGALGGRFWIFIAIAVGLSASRFSEAFLLLRAQNLGLGETGIPLIFVTMNIVFALASFPAGRLSDHIGRDALLVSGFAVLILAQVFAAVAPSPALVFVAAALWGLHLGLTQGVFSAVVADLAPARLRGTGFGIFYLAVGVALFVGSIGAGELWQHVSPAAPFAVGAALAAISVIAYEPLRRRARKRAAR